MEQPVSYSKKIDNNVVRQPSTQFMTVPITSEEVYNFPDDMLDVIHEPPFNPPVSTGRTVTPRVISTSPLKT